MSAKSDAMYVELAKLFDLAKLLKTQFPTLSNHLMRMHAALEIEIAKDKDDHANHAVLSADEIEKIARNTVKTVTSALALKNDGHKKEKIEELIGEYKNSMDALPNKTDNKEIVSSQANVLDTLYGIGYLFLYAIGGIVNYIETPHSLATTAQDMLSFGYNFFKMLAVDVPNVIIDKSTAKAKSFCEAAKKSLFAPPSPFETSGLTLFGNNIASSLQELEEDKVPEVTIDNKMTM